ncbi:ATP-dependent nuclease [Mycobacteroides abscessus]|uniref:ATP-dependent nuclease n=1 Tax=Mycobacteroides abscessus TaxID=36809 RepID=UPI0002DC5134|nr:TOPRIM nucleotidyl transferase/hydrolase domain-containing protein [Mycobacteroides abscessus]
MHIESVKLTNFQCFGATSTTVDLDDQLTAFVGGNGSGKTAVCGALMRLFGITNDQRTIQVDDFHVPADEVDAPATRTLIIEVVLAFPELDESKPQNEASEKTDQPDGEATDESTQNASSGHGGGPGSPSKTGAERDAVPEFFQQMAATVDGQLKCRIVLDATWTDDGSIDGVIEDQRRVVYTFDEDYGDRWVPLRAGDRNRIQVIYVPASRDGARYVTTFLRGRLWRASTWSEELETHVATSAEETTRKFRAEPAVTTVERVLTRRWGELHQADTDCDPSLEPANRTAREIAGRAELMFQPSHTGRQRRAAALSDGQRSLLQLALTAATLDVEKRLSKGSVDGFELPTAQLPRLTLLIVEEPENNLSPFFLSRVVHQMLDLTTDPRSQALLSSHSAGALSRIEPHRIRHFRLDQSEGCAVVTKVILPDGETDAGKYVREAVRAYPELYFARYVVLGEGDSEATVLPCIAEARGVPLDRSFIAMVPLGGRHTNHFWRLLNDLHIPHLTLLDLDYGRHGGGSGRIKDACDQLAAVGVDPFEGIDGYTSTDDLKNIDVDAIKAWIAHLKSWAIYFSAPLDLDMLLLTTYRDQYTKLEPGASGPKKNDDPTSTVLGDGHTATELWAKPKNIELLRWYRYLFLSKSKPSTHLRAMAGMSHSDLAKAPPTLIEIIDRIKTDLQLT